MIAKRSPEVDVAFAGFDRGSFGAAVLEAGLSAAAWVSVFEHATRHVANPSAPIQVFIISVVPLV
ncbi:MAG: hypothetical protein AB7L28_17105 [Kofleriaceae bacterium]